MQMSAEQTVNKFESCNYKMYRFLGSDASQVILIVAYSLLGVFLLVQMCRLCSKVFSYHKFHIHQAYRFYTIAFFSVVLIIISRFTQLKLNDVESNWVKIQSPIDSQTINEYQEHNLYGWRIFNQLAGIISISVTNIMYILIGFTWLNIAWGCDFADDTSQVSNTLQSIGQTPLERYNQFRHETMQSQKESLKKKIRIAKNLGFYFVYPFFILFCTFATLQRSKSMCQGATIVMLLSTQLGLFLLGYSIIFFLSKRLRDSQTPLYSKIILIYLLISMAARCIWFNIIALEGEQGHINQIVQVLYNIAVSIGPIFSLSLLSEKLLSKEKSTLFRTNSRIMNMQSTLI